jgi:hypothetical protein
MCKKKDDPEPSATSQRVTGYKILINDTVVMKGAFQYTGNLGSALIITDAGSFEIQKTTFQYSGNEINNVTDYERISGSLVKYSFKEVTGYTGNNPLQVISHYYDDAGIETTQEKTIYTYDGSLLKKTDDYHYYSGTWEPAGTTSFTYDNQGRILQEYDTSGYYGQITTHSYVNNQRTESLTQDYFEGVLTNDSKTSYEYANNRLSKSIFFNWQSGAWEKEEEIGYTYNGLGNLASESWESYYFSARIEYTYGDGIGNYRQCAKIAGGEFIFPGDPTPYPVKSSRPSSGFPFRPDFIHKDH